MIGEIGHFATWLALAVACSVPLVLLAMIPPLRFGGWEWVSLALATPVVFWSGFGFHRVALLNARHGAVSMDSLVSLGTLAAWVGRYYETAAVITALILLGRFLEDRARRRSGVPSSARPRNARSSVSPSGRRAASDDAGRSAQQAATSTASGPTSWSWAPPWCSWR